MLTAPAYANGVMQETTETAGSPRLSQQVKATYWAALLLIAFMTTTSYVLLDRELSAHREDRELLVLVGSQRTLSQRIFFLANQVKSAPEAAHPDLLASLRAVTSDFERDYDRMVRMSGAEGGGGRDAALFEGILFGSPYHLDHFATALSTRAHRYVAAVEREKGRAVMSSGYSSLSELSYLDRAVAEKTLNGFAELRDRMVDVIGSRTANMLTLQRTLYFLTIGLVIAVALFIFQPMTRAIVRRTKELTEAHNSMAFLAAHDGLTGLRNRAFLIDHFEAMINGARRRGERIAVLQLDLDGFKRINDTLGHAAGDYVLATTARRMRDCSRDSDLCIRLGGDEFVILLSAPGESDDIAATARRVLDRINEPMNFEGATIHCPASVGIAVYPVDAETPGDLLVHADLALYNAKRSSPGTFCFFSDELRLELEHRKAVERDLRIAINDRSFEVYFQPQVSQSSGAVVGVEALVRWPHPERGMVSPADFIPVAEKTGLMARIGRIVMDKAIAAAAEWHHEGIEFGRLAVNASGMELRETEFTRFLFETLGRTGLPAQKLSLEIVESVILDDEKTGIAGKLRMIRAAGVHLELDDFGTGYASLSHVNPKEIDRLKIDRRFVQKIDTNDDNRTIVKAITELARGLGISVIAEGAETEEELASLRAVGCDHVQGYSIAYPMPAERVREWLSQRAPRRPRLKVAASNVA